LLRFHGRALFRFCALEMATCQRRGAAVLGEADRPIARRSGGKLYYRRCRRHHLRHRTSRKRCWAREINTFRYADFPRVRPDTGPPYVFYSLDPLQTWAPDPIFRAQTSLADKRVYGVE